MNAGGVLNTCKSNGEFFVLVQRASSGERVSNALVTCPEVRDNSSKGLLIPHVISEVRDFEMKGVIRFGRGLRPISLLVG
jgi:hypothetical protein